MAHLQASFRDGGGHSLTTLLCIFLSALLTRRLALLFCCTGFCCILAAAAIENPLALERKVLLRVEENVLGVIRGVLFGGGVEN